RRANGQVLVSLTLAQREVPVAVALRLYLPEAWTADPVRCRKAGVPEGVGFRTKAQIALAELDRVRAGGAQFGYVLADADYGSAAEFRKGLSERGLVYAVGILATQLIYPADVSLLWPEPKATGGRPRRHPMPTAEPMSAEAMIEVLG